MPQGAYYGRSRAYSSLTADIEEFVRKSEDRLLAVMRLSIQDVVENAQQATEKGGRMRVDTGFLRASGRASLGGWPSGPSERPVPKPPKNSFSYNGEAVNATLGKMKLGDTFYFGWTANYARYRELYDGFLEASMQNWARYVAFHSEQYRDR